MEVTLFAAAGSKLICLGRPIGPGTRLECAGVMGALWMKVSGDSSPLSWLLAPLSPRIIKVRGGVCIAPSSIATGAFSWREAARDLGSLCVSEGAAEGSAE